MTELGSPLDVSLDGSVLRLTLNRPRQGNALDVDLARSLTRAFSQLSEAVSVVRLGAAGKVFCAGGDVGEFARSAEPGKFVRELADEAHRVVTAIQNCQVPVVAAVHGNVGGAGLGLVAACDIAVASSAARFRPAYIGLGLTPDAGLTWRLTRQIGTARTLDLLLTDGYLTAEEALGAGLISRISEDADSEANRVAEALASGPAEAYARIKQLVHGAADRSLAEQLSLEAASISASAASPDGAEGIAAFVERRPARFSGGRHDLTAGDR
jgi:2-(1,2-epoxy-1,2-dihydrophenyl)acetyl-CoA isomerase